MKIKVNKVEYDLDVAAALKSGLAKKVVKKKPVFNGYDKYYAGSYYMYKTIQLMLVKYSAGFVFVCLEDGHVWNEPFEPLNITYATRDEIKRNIDGWGMIRELPGSSVNGPHFEVYFPKINREIFLNQRSYSFNQEAAERCGFLIPNQFEVGDTFNFDVTTLLLVEFSKDTFGFVDIFTGFVYKEFSEIGDNYPFTFKQLASVLGGSFKRVNMAFTINPKLFPL